MRYAFGFLIFVCGSIAVADNFPDVKSQIESRAIKYFIENAHPVTGQVRDRADNFTVSAGPNRVASIAATGFGLAVIANGAGRGTVDRSFAHDYVLKTLKFASDHVPRRKGWFVHFYDWETGSRVFNSEYSTIDTALFMAGALYASHVFKDPQMAALVSGLYENMDFWDAMTDGGTQPLKRTLSMAYTESKSYTSAQWNMYAEEMILLIMGLGHPRHPLPPESWGAFSRALKKIPSSGQEVMGLDQALFVHQYSQLYLDFRNFSDGYKNYFENSREVSDYHRELSSSEKKYKTFREGFWGLSAGETPYGYGASNALDYQSTVCIACAVASAPYSPKAILSDAQNWIDGIYSPQIWGRYGITDSLDLDQNWFSPYVLGITVGPEYLALANLDPLTSIWSVFMEIPEVKNGLALAAQGINLLQSSTN